MTRLAPSLQDCRGWVRGAGDNGRDIMAEVLVEFDTVVVGDDGTRWSPQVCGGVADDGLWEGWIEFTSANSSIAPVRTPRETEQSKRDDLMYWAQGLSQVYLEQALRRAIASPPTSTKAHRT